MLFTGGLMAVFLGPLYPSVGFVGGVLAFAGAAVAIHAEFRR
jgi:hypothetical protein